MTDDPRTFDEIVDEIRAPLAELEAHLDELDVPARDFARGMRAALTRYDGGVETSGALPPTMPGGVDGPGIPESQVWGGSTEQGGSSSSRPGVSRSRGLA